MLFVFPFLLLNTSASGQTDWYDPLSVEFPVIEGRFVNKNNYFRLPSELQHAVRKEVWELSKNSAGLSLGFFTDATGIHVKYTVKGNLQMPHMPATGVSGVDLFVKESEKEWNWIRGVYNFGDTIQYIFRIDPNPNVEKEFKLFLPLYNGVEHLSIGVKEGRRFEFIKKNTHAPIVVYGTSIAQGACASRPAMAWTTILQQALGMSLVNLGFSGNGLLEKELIDWISEKESSLIILDCLPNFTPGKGISDDEIRARIQYAARKLRSDNPKVPVLFAAHAGYSDQYVDHSRRELVSKLNTILLEELDKLWKEGVNEIHHLSSEAIGLDQFDFVDGTHPTDGGMLKYANAYRYKILEIYKGGRK